MLGENDPTYYAKRERQARDLAAAARDPQIRAVHLDMAERYAKLREGGEPARFTR